MVTGLHLALVRAAPEARVRNAGLLAGLLLWMLYTRYFATAQALHATLPPCPFLLVTGHPCPFCGGTRSFAGMWHGDLGRAAALYPLGPALFFAVLAAIPVLAAAVVLGRDLRWNLSSSWGRALAAAACLPLAASWVLKLTVLPN
ncbi:MAG: hypothetical protein DLM67_21345 [Candidatus Nephthysia bennettiae]|nr:MAG: hypothetical protein DLM67_21345 [Candidatus Dormibacteraeota bacterium]